MNQKYFFSLLAFLFVLTLSGKGWADDTTKAASPAPETAASAGEESSATSEKSGGPTFSGAAAEVKKKMVELFEVSKKVNRSGAEGAKARGEIRKAMDWDRIALECVGSVAWKKQPVEKREKFTSLLREVIEKTAFGRLSKFWINTSYRIDKVEVKGSEAHIPAKFYAQGQAKPFTLDYYFVDKGGKWLIHDISYDGLRYSENIHEQLDAFLKEKSFNQLLEKLRQRRDELTSESAKPAKSEKKGK